MENNQIVIASVKPTFKNKDLNTATTAIFDAVNKYNTTAAETRKTVSVVLARVEAKKTYKDDGFKSLAEYAEKIGLDKSLAHKMENAGRLLDSKDATVRDFAAAADYSKLAILASAPESDIAAAVKSGELSAEKSQREVKAWKDANNAKSAKPKVVPTWHITGHSFIVEKDGNCVHDIIDTIVGIANPADWAREFDSTLCVAKTSVAEMNYYLAVNATGLLIQYTATKVVKEKTPKGKPSRSQLEKLIEEYKAKLAAMADAEEEYDEEGE